jgi:NifU-like protein involved in Fe-S cluster formation
VGVPRIVVDHYKNPRNKRALDGATAQGTVVGRKPGEQLTVYLKVEGGRVADASFTNTGDRMEDPGASALTGLVRGLGLNDLERLSVSDPAVRARAAAHYRRRRADVDARQLRVPELPARYRGHHRPGARTSARNVADRSCAGLLRGHLLVVLVLGRISVNLPPSMADIAIPLPDLRFPQAGWRDRFHRYVRDAESRGLELEAHLEPPVTDAALAAAPLVQGALRALYAGANGGRIGHVHLLPIAAVAGPSFGNDYVGSYRFLPDEPHEVILAPREGSEEHRFTNLGTFLDAMLVRAYAGALHRKAEVDQGDDLDEEPWVLASRELELRIDPKLLRTRED